MSRTVITGNTEYFPGIEQIRFEGPESDNPLAFKSYDPARQVAGKTMEEHLRFAVCYWHTFCANGGDPFGPGTREYPWATRSDPMDRSRDRIDAAFEFSIISINGISTPLFLRGNGPLTLKTQFVDPTWGPCFFATNGRRGHRQHQITQFFQTVVDVARLFPESLAGENQLTLLVD